MKFDIETIEPVETGDEDAVVIVLQLSPDKDGVLVWARQGEVCRMLMRLDEDGLNLREDCWPLPLPLDEDGKLKLVQAKETER